MGCIGPASGIERKPRAQRSHRLGADLRIEVNDIGHSRSLAPLQELSCIRIDFICEFSHATWPANLRLLGRSLRRSIGELPQGIKIENDDDRVGRERSPKPVLEIRQLRRASGIRCRRGCRPDRDSMRKPLAQRQRETGRHFRTSVRNVGNTLLLAAIDDIGRRHAELFGELLNRQHGGLLRHGNLQIGMLGSSIEREYSS